MYPIRSANRTSWPRLPNNLINNPPHHRCGMAIAQTNFGDHVESSARAFKFCRVSRAQFIHTHTHTHTRVRSRRFFEFRVTATYFESRSSARCYFLLPLSLHLLPFFSLSFIHPKLYKFYFCYIFARNYTVSHELQALVGAFF